MRLLTTLLRDKQIGKHVVPIVPDESRTFGMEGLFRQFGIFSQVGQLYRPEDANQLMFYKEDRGGQLLQEGINEPGAMATVYHELGTQITVVELMDQIIPGADKDLITPLMRRIEKRYANIFLKTRVTQVEARPDGLVVRFEGPKAPASDTFDKVLVAVGRKPNGRLIGAENAGVTVDECGFIPVDKQLRTNVPHIFAIGDVVDQPMLAHEAVHEGKVAAEVAWVGVTEGEARAKGMRCGKGVFPWAASGRSLSLGRDEGMTKVLFDADTERVIGCGIVGPGAGDLISEAALAIEMGADARDIGLTIHPHPTLSETIGMAAEAFEGTITDLYLPKKS